MSYYYKYNFISPEPTFAVVKEELKSYFDSGAVDTLMFPTYVDKCLRKLGKTGFDIYETVLQLDDFQSRLPDNFKYVREAWLCTNVNSLPHQSANSLYSQAASSTTIQISPIVTNQPCQNIECTTDNCTGCMPELIQAVYKTNNSTMFSYKREYLLKPGNISTKKYCSTDCANFGSSAPDTFDIRDNKFTTNFRKGDVYLIYYGTEYDDSGLQLVPDNYRILEWIESFLKYKVFETLSNQVNDETFNQIQAKLAYYKQESEEKYILAETEVKKQTAYEKQRAIKRNLNRFQMYELPNSNSRLRYGWRNNGTQY